MKKTFSEKDDPQFYNSAKLYLVSAEKILEWSHGEVKNSETINYRTNKPERDGLFCGRIFGPVVDYECVCGKYKKMKHRDITCEKCGVQVIESKVRRERLGHINLCVPIAHSWFLKRAPSLLAIALDLSLKDVELVLHFESYIVFDAGSTSLKIGELISKEDYEKHDYADDDLEAGMGAEAIKETLDNLDIEQIIEQLKIEIKECKSEMKRKNFTRRFEVLDSFRRSGGKMSNMILTVLPVISPDLRPLVALDGGKFATSDLNDLYRRVIHRNNRLKRLIELNAPDIIVKNEKRMLQESVDSLFDNTRSARAILGANGRPLKSLSDNLRGKYGRFRQNLLGKRVDYSARTVIVVGPNLKLNECGIPKKMALELFKPFVLGYLLNHDYASTIRAAKRMLETDDPLIWKALETVTRGYPVLLNRAPTLHRLGIQAFEIKLIAEKAIQLHPLVCTAFNADFDGDQMAVHIPLSIEAQTEAKMLMMAHNNILSPATGKPIMIPTKDMVLGIYWMSKSFPKRKGEGKIFSSILQVIAAYEHEFVDLQAIIKVRIEDKIYDTTAGRVILYDVFPKSISFETINKVLKQKDIENLVDLCYRFAGNVVTVDILDKLKDLGFKYATIAGFSIAITDMTIPSEKDKLVKKTEKEVLKIQRQHEEGIITDNERYNRVINLWSLTTEDIANRMLDILSKEREVDGMMQMNPIFAMADSGARGSTNQNKQLCGMRGLMAKPSGAIIETPITVNFREGLNSQQYFISTHGARKGLADTALKTARSGYLTRKLVDVAQDSVISVRDCGTSNKFIIEALIENGEIIERIGERILGRIAAEDVLHPYTKELLVKQGTMFDENNIVAIDKSLITSVAVRSPLTCEAERGFCVLCYGRDLARGKMVSIGEAVGIIAAQSIGEPGTQLTMRTFHIGGTASSKIEETSWDCQKPGKIILDKVNTVINKDNVQVVVDQNSEVSIVNDEGYDVDRLKLPLGAKIFFKHNDEIKIGDTISEWDPFSVPILSNEVGIVQFCDIIENKSMVVETDDNTGISRAVIVENYEYDLKPSIRLVDDKGKRVVRKDGSWRKDFDLPVRSELVVRDGDKIKAGDILAKIPRESAKTKDITGGLPRVVDLFEARVPKNPCQISEISGKVEIGENARRKKKIIIHPDVGESKSYLINRGDFIRVLDDEIIKAGDLLTDGVQNPHDILKIKGLVALQRYLVNEVLEIYRMQGVKINDKHVEVIVTHMLKKVEITETGDSNFLEGKKIFKHFFGAENKRLESEGKRKAEAKPVLLGIMQASLSTESFISAASFQETTKVLTASAAEGKIDYFRGPKENVILGRLIPVGTGFHYNTKEHGYEIVDNMAQTDYTESKYITDKKFISEETVD